jgi:hypothetical protein
MKARKGDQPKLKIAIVQDANGGLKLQYRDAEDAEMREEKKE